MIREIIEEVAPGRAEDVIRLAGSEYALSMIAPGRLAEAGITEKQAKIILLAARAAREGLRPERLALGPQIAKQKIQEMIGKEEQECFAVITFDNNGGILAERILYRGTVSASLVRPAEVFRDAVMYNGSAIVVGHNHPSGKTSPSQEDISITARLKSAGEILEVQLLDHIIATGEESISLLEKGLM